MINFLKDNKLGYLLIWLIMFMAFPFSISQAYDLPAKMIMSILTVFLIVGVLMKLKDIKLNPTMSFIFLFQISSFLFKMNISNSFTLNKV